MRKLQFKFPSQIRISGWDFGSSARAMNQAGGKDSLMTYERELATQAVRAKYARMTFERKSMSTKTTIKRIALVAVSALGLGVLTTVGASATAVTVGASTGFSTNASSITLVKTDSTLANNYAVFEVSLANASGYAAPLQAGETLTAEVIANPLPTNPSATVTTNGDLTAKWLTSYTPATGAGSTSYSSSDSGTTINSTNDGSALDSGYWDLDLAAAKRGGTSATTTGYTTTASTATATYALKVWATGANSVDAGFYSIRISLLDSNSNAIKTQIVKFAVASSKLTSGAVLTASATGSQVAGAALEASTTQIITATVKDANGGLVREGTNTAATVSGSVKDAATTAHTDTITFDDDGNTTGTKVALDGSYEASGTLTTNVAGTSTVKVLYGAATPATASLVVTSASGTYYGNTSVSATGKIADSSNYILPLTTKSASVALTLYSAADATATSTTAVSNSTVYYTLTYGSSCVLGDMTPTKVSAAKKATTDANGQVVIDITNAAPQDGCSVTVTFSGATVITTAASGVTKSLARTLTWNKAAATSVVTTPAGDYLSALKGANKVTWQILDQFGSPVVGSIVQFSHTGANKPASTTTAPTATTDANGQVSYSWTDAAAVDADTDVVAIAKVDGVAFAKGSVTVTYKATMPTIAKLYSTYTTTDGTNTLTGLVPTTAIGGSAGVPTSAADQIDLTKVVTGAATAPWVKLNFTAKTAADVATAGIPTTVTVKGAKLIGSNGKLADSVIVYANDDVYVLGTTAGTATVTATNGTLTSTATINFVNAAGDARVLALAVNGSVATASVTDAFGSPVKGVSVDVVGSGGAWLGNGATTASFSTAADGTVSFAVTGAGTITASLSKSTYAKVKNLAGAGNSTGSVVTTGAPAGVSSVSADVTGLGATDAADAANEATDAANAATDAANAAAEAADAATAAAQDAQAAVAALATQVASLIAGIKAQITTLTNLVVKIQKKVKA